MISLEAMSTEPQVSPAAETQNPAADALNPEVATQETAVDDEAEGVSQDEESGDDAEKALKKMQRRIDKRTADVYRERARAEQLERRLTELEAKSGQTEPKQEDSKADPVALAKEIARVERFAEEAEKLVADGSKKHKDFMPALKALADEVGPFVLPNGLPSPFMEAVREVADKPMELLYHLGKNPELAEELTGLSPLKLAKRLDRIEREMAEAGKTKTSSAPKPLAPVKGAAADSELGPGLSDAEWMRRREAQLKESRGR